MPTRKRSREDVDEGARKKFKQHRSGERSERSPSSEMGGISPDRDVPVESMPSAPSEPDGESSKVLQLLHADFDALRNLVTCKICERLLYEPYVLSCGHTYCYSCLCTWFQDKKKKTCPNCRDVVQQMPAPSYVIKEMTTVFVGRAELLPEGETIQQHAQWQKEEAEIVQRDKNDDDRRTGGLFKGSFNHHRHRAGPIFDREDNVERCPGCNWEIEDGMCNNCGFLVDEDFDIGSEDEISDDVSEEIDDEDIDQDDFDAEDGVDYDHHHHQPYDIILHGVPPGSHNQRNIMRRYGLTMDIDSDEEEEDDNSIHSSMNDFIVDEAQEDDSRTAAALSSDDDQSSAQSTPRRRQRRIVIDSDDDDGEDGEDGEVSTLPPTRRTRVHIIDSSEEEDSEPAPHVLSSRHASSRRNAPAITIVDSDDDDLNIDSEDAESDGRSESLGDDSSMRHHSDDDAVDNDDDIGVRGGEYDENEHSSFDDDDDRPDDNEQYGFSPLQHSVDEEQDSSEDGEGDEHEQWPGQAHSFVPARTLQRPRSILPMHAAYRTARQHTTSVSPPPTDVRLDILPGHSAASQVLARLRNVFGNRIDSGTHRQTVNYCYREQYSKSTNPEVETDNGSSSEILAEDSTASTIHRDRRQTYANNSSLLLPPMTVSEMSRHLREQYINNGEPQMVLNRPNVVNPYSDHQCPPMTFVRPYRETRNAMRSNTALVNDGSQNICSERPRTGPTSSRRSQDKSGPHFVDPHDYDDG